MPKVFVGLSGGVDSAVSAVLLKKATPNNFEKLFGRPTPKGFRGYDVTGVFIKAWTPEGYPCTWKEDRRSAMRVAAVLDIPFITLDLEKEYKKEVVDYMIAEYKAGRTPNPDVMCNKEIKFGRFLKFALKSGADFVATGHYARIKHLEHLRKASFKKSSDPLPANWRVGQTFFKNFSEMLLEGSDKNKDQSYFLWTLTQEQLKHIIFPIGHLQKSEVRKLAKKFGLPQAARKDSQGLCFLGQIDMKEFLKEYVGAKKGGVLNEKGEIIGEHDGATLYTIGERHGFNVTNKSDNKEPFYVVSKNIKENTIVVAPKNADSQQKNASQKVLGFPRPISSDSARLFSQHFSVGHDSIILQDINLTAEIPNKKILCRVRYRQNKVKCKVEKEKGEFKVTFDEPQIISPGQSLVLYDGEKCLGGGIIK